MKILAINCNPDLSYFTKRGLTLDIEYKTVNEIFPLKYLYEVKDSNGNMLPMYTPDVSIYLEANYKEYKHSFIIIGWKPSDYSPVLKNTGGYTSPNPLKCGTYWMTVRQDQFPVNNYAIHELHHAICDVINQKLINAHAIDYMDITPVNGIMTPYYLNNFPDNPNSNYAVTWNNIKPYLSQLNAITYNTMPTYQYFKPNEIVNLNPSLVQILDKARGLANTPFKLTSGFRTPEQNKLAGGKPNSAHLRGLAVDIFCTDNTKRTQILKGLLNCGSDVFTEIAKSHIHVDIDSSIHTLGQTIVLDDE